jgi:hypothetical protein
MRFATTPLIALILASLAGVVRSGGTRGNYDVRLLGLPVGKMQFASRDDDRAYAFTGAFNTRGVGRIVDAGFRLSAQGRLSKGRLRPTTNDEQIDTGSRRSTVQMRYSGSIPRITSGSVVAEVADDPNALNPAAQGGTVDPLTALWGVLRDRPDAGLCQYDVAIFDGQRQSRLAMTARNEAGGRVTCTGAYTRLKGFSASELKRQTVYPFTVTYAPSGALMQAQSLSVRSTYGTAEMTRD